MKVDQTVLERVLKGWEWSERTIEVPFLFNSLPEPPARILDIGSCESRLCVELQDLGFDVWGLDLRDYEMWNKGLKNFVKADARDIPFDDNTFDVVSSISTTEHIGLVDTPYKTDSVFDRDGDIISFNEMMRVLKPGGSVVLTLPYGICNDPGLLKWIRFYSINNISRFTSNPDLEVDVICYSKLLNLKEGWVVTDRDTAAHVVSNQFVHAGVCILGHKRIK
jgi:SAM-dependent methyltransferase